MDEGHVLVMASGANESRLGLLLREIAAQGLTVVRGPDIGGYPSYAEEVDAAALLMPSGAQGWPDLQQFPIDRFAREGQLVFVNLDATPQAPPAGGDAMYFDLAGWAGDGSLELDRLIEHLRALIATPLSEQHHWKLDAGQVGTATSGITELQSLTDKIGQIGDALSGDEQASRPLRETLDEIGGTYRVVKSAVERFVAAGLSRGGPDAQVYAGLAHGPLAQQIRNGRGHCRRIGRRYRCISGLRDNLAPKLSPITLADLDATFDRLASADGDVFSAMDALGYALTNESQIIVRHLLTGRNEPARRHIAGAIDRLVPLERALEEALAAFQVVTSAIGYAESSPREKEIIYMSKIEIHGDVINANVVAAQTIENSQIAVKNSAAPQDLKVVLEELHEAAKNLTSRLSADDAALAAKDLKDLAEEAVSPTPNRAIWRRAADGLLAAAKSAGETGIVVVDLVSKVATLLGYPLGV
jgi:hypothetical protein